MTINVSGLIIHHTPYTIQMTINVSGLMHHTSYTIHYTDDHQRLWSHRTSYIIHHTPYTIQMTINVSGLIASKVAGGLVVDDGEEKD
jgi:hypothetical protein